MITAPFPRPIGFAATRRSATSLVVPLAVATLLMALSPTADAQWRWRDKNGQVNASDRPPPKEVPDKDILSRPAADARRSAAAAAQAAAPAAGAEGTAAAAAAPAAPAAASASAPPTALEREVQARKRSAEQEQAAKAKAEEERQSTQRAENCRAARGHLVALDSGQRISRTNDKGEREVLDDKGRADEQRRAREVVASDCR